VKGIKNLFKNTDNRIKFLLVLVCAYMMVMAGFQDVGAVSELAGYEPAISVVVQDGTEEAKTYLLKKGTVEQALSDLEITLNEEDTLNLALTDQVTEGTTLEITRVTYEEVKETEDIPFETARCLAIRSYRKGSMVPRKIRIRYVWSMVWKRVVL
jgi:hypothetical protein